MAGIILAQLPDFDIVFTSIFFEHGFSTPRGPFLEQFRLIRESSCPFLSTEAGIVLGRNSSF